MKTKFLAILAFIAMATASHGQFLPGPSTGNALTISTAYRINGELTTNVTGALNIPIGKNGLGLFFRVAGTNATTTTNMTVTLEQTVDGSNWIDDHTFTFSVPQNGTSGYDVYTNILPTAVNFNNARYLRIKSIQNTNTGSVFVSNAVWSILQ